MEDDYFFEIFGMSGIRLTNISIIDIPWLSNFFIFKTIASFLENVLGDKTCDANPRI